jgi:phage replication O-like protein O
MAQANRVINIDEHRADGPQLENGHVRIANELLDAILTFGFSGRQLHVVLTVLRKTYGYNKKHDDMSASQIGAMCGVSRNHVTETLNQLHEVRVITKRGGEYGCVIGINKHYDQWIASPKKGLVPNRDASPKKGLEVVPNRDGSVVPNRDTQKTTFQKTTSKDKHTALGAEKPAPSMPEEFAEFWSIYPKREGSNSKADALKAWNARIRSGIPADELLTGLRRYAAYCKAKGSIGTQFVKQAASFLGTGEHWRDDWSVLQAAAPASRLRAPEPERFDTKDYGTGGLL